MHKYRNLINKLMKSSIWSGETTLSPMELSLASLTRSENYREKKVLKPHSHKVEVKTKMRRNPSIRAHQDRKILKNESSQRVKNNYIYFLVGFALVKSLFFRMF